MPEQATARQDAALPGLDAVEQDFAAVRRGLGDAHAALEHQRKAAAGLIGIEQHIACGGMQQLRFAEQRIQALRRQLRE